MVRSGVFSPFSRSVPLRSKESVVVEVPQHELREAPLVLQEVAHLELPPQVVDERLRLGEVLLDRRQLLVAAAAARQGLLEGAVLEELLPVDLLDPLVVGPLLEVRDFHLLGRHGRGVRLARLYLYRDLAVLGVAVGPGARVDFLVGEHGVRIELLADLVDQLEPRELEQADGLLQLGRHHQLLAQLELLLDLHRALSPVRTNTHSADRQPLTGDFRATC